MKKLVTAALALSCLTGYAKDSKIPDMLLSIYGGGATIVENGEPVWNFGARKAPCQDAWKLADGNFLIPTSDTIQIVNSDKEVIWKYKEITPKFLKKKPKHYKGKKEWKPKKIELHTCQPLPNGNILIGEAAYARIIEVDKKGNIAKTIELEGERPNNHGGMRIARKTKQGTYVAAISKDRVCEFDENGKKLRTVSKKTTKKDNIKWGHVHGLAIMKNGNWLIGTGYGATFFEIDKNDKIVWKLTPEDVPSVGLKYAGGAQRLKDGTTVMTGWQKSKHQVFAVDKNNKLLWKWKTPGKDWKMRGVTNVQILGEKGDPAKLQLQK